MSDIVLSDKDLEFTKELFKKEEKNPKCFFIQDDLNLLSTNQKLKIKKWCKENEYDEMKLLSTIFYSTNTKKKYNQIERRWDDKNHYYILRFLNKPTEKELLKEKLREKIKSFRDQRTSYDPSPSISTKKKQMWEMYDKIKSIPQVRGIPLNILDIALPNPDKILEDKETYMKNYEQIPNSCIKEYFKLCLSL
jgi:hypothetical protein